MSSLFLRPQFPDASQGGGKSLLMDKASASPSATRELCVGAVLSMARFFWGVSFILVSSFVRYLVTTLGKFQFFLSVDLWNRIYFHSF